MQDLGEGLSIRRHDPATRRRRLKTSFWPFAASVAALACAWPLSPAGAQSGTEIALTELGQNTHIHGLAVDGRDSSRILIATHHGLFRAGPDGKAVLVSPVQDFMGFNAHPSDPDTLYASGHPATGGNLGLIASTDQGRTWQQISPGANGPVDFHQMTVSPADPNTIFGVYGGIQVSRDAGKSWTALGSAPERVIDLAASSASPNTVYAATERGLAVSTDAGESWTTVLWGAPVSAVETTADGSVYAFVVGRGLLHSKEEPLNFVPVSQDFGEQYLLHLAVDPGEPSRLFAATGNGTIMSSLDQGRTWTPWGTQSGVAPQ